MISKESIDEMRKMNEQLDSLEERLAKLFVKVNKYLKMNKDQAPKRTKDKVEKQ